MGTMKYLLDTCVFLWVSQQPSMLSKIAAEICNDPANQLFVSDVSVWEVVLKNSAGKLPLPGIAKTWIAEKFEYHQFKHLAIEQDSIFRSGELPRIHSDPFDRLITAIGIGHGMTILSPDTPLSLLGASRMW